MKTMPGLLALNDDVMIIPVSELSEESRAQAECLPNDFAVSRTRGRSGSSIIDADSARLLDRFREPRSVVEAVILYSREKRMDAAEVLESAYPFLMGMVQRQVLVAATEGERGDVSEERWTAGTRLPFGTIIRALQILDDGEVYQIARPGGARAILKIERASAQAVLGDDPARLRHESRVLGILDGQVGPRLLDEGELDGRRYLVVELLYGVDATTAMLPFRDQPARVRLIAARALAQQICIAYERLHALGALHGDVHPRNILVLRDGTVRLIDFGFASGIDDASAIPCITERGGVPFYYEPEFARASLEGRNASGASVAGEVFAVAAVIFGLATGEHWQRFRLGRNEMLFDIAHGVRRSFADCGSDVWPDFERVLARALSTDPRARWRSIAELSSALAEVGAPPQVQIRTSVSSTNYHDRVLLDLRSDGSFFDQPLPAPNLSINYGAAGIALGALHASQRRASPELLASADAWIRRSLRDVASDDGFYDSKIEITRETVGESSPYHSPSGLHAVDALIARASGDVARQARSISRYLESVRRPAKGLDLTLGTSSKLLGAAILLDAVPSTDAASESALCAFGAGTMRDLWLQLDEKERVGAGDVEYLGIAHGWAGFLYATLTWCQVAKVAIPENAERRLDELVALALPTGRGLEWAWSLRQSGDPAAMSGWCNGSCGYVFLWSLAHQMLGHERYFDAAIGAAWDSWESPNPAPTLCCGLAGRAYALLRLHRHTGDRVWLDRARQLGAWAAREGMSYPEHPHSLYKGAFGVAILAADLEDPEWGRMPFFEPTGYRM